MKHGAWLERNRRAQANEIAGLPWVADGVDDGEREAAELLIAVALWHPDLFAGLLEKTWLGDNITVAESETLYGLRWAARYAPDLAERMLSKSWLQDEISRDEARIIRYLYPMAWYQDEPNKPVVERAIQILDMPFLETVEGPDVLAVRSLRRLESIDEDNFLATMTHPTLSDGITDEEAKIVALVGGTYSYRPRSVAVLLAGSGVYVEERTIGLPRSGEVSLAIIRIRDQVTPSMDFLEQSVRTIEDFMGQPFPTNYIALYFDDATVNPLGGTNFGTHMAMSLLYDVENGRLWDRTPFVIAHEVAHYFWDGGNRDWIDEAAAELLASISENKRVAAPVEVTNKPCASAKTIGELERLDAKVNTNAFRCNYSLGERFFLDLYHTLGEDAFRRGFRSLYLKTRHDDPTDGCDGADLNICHVATAFKSGVSDAVAAKVDEIIARWYGPLP